MVNYDGTDYVGYRLDLTNVKTFSETVDLTGSDLETPILQFVITPSVRGTANTYSPDFEKLVFTFTDADGKALSIGFAPRTDYSANYLQGFASGENQKLLGEHHRNGFSSVDGNPSEQDTDEYLSNAYASISPYSFDGYAKTLDTYTGNNFPFRDKYGQSFKRGSNGVISIYYSAEENAVYADSGHRCEEDLKSAHPNWQVPERLKKLPNGERRYRIRDLDKKYTTDDVQWNGFTNLEDITCTVSFGDLKTDDPSILLVSLGGKSLVSNFSVENHTKAVKNVPFTIPKPQFFSEGQLFDFVSESGRIEIKDSNGNVVLSERNYAQDMQFTPTQAGRYSLIYSAINPLTSNKVSYTYSLGTVESGGTVLTPYGYVRDYVVYETVDAGCAVFNDVQDYLPQVNLTISKNGSEIYSKNDLRELEYKFTEEGDYVFTYSSVDLLGRETTKERIYHVNAYFLKSADSINTTTVVNDSSKAGILSKADFEVYNAYSGKISGNLYKADITVSKNGGAFLKYTLASFNGDGNYVIKYVYSFLSAELADVQLTAERKIVVFSDLPTITVNNIPNNTVLDKGSALEDDSIKLIALKDSVISIPKTLFASNLPITVSIYQDGGEFTDVSDAYNAGTLSLELSELKNYYVSATVSTAQGFTVNKNLFITVKSAVINIAPVEDRTENVGHGITLIVPQAKDINGNVISGGSITVLLNGKEIEIKNGTFTPKDLGVYKVVYSATLSGITETYEYFYRIIDSEKPIITLGNVDKTASSGDFVKIGGYKVSDNSDNDMEISVKVFFNGKDVSVYNGGFYADKAGDYTVKITATDMSGNTGETEYTVAVSEGGGCSSAIDVDGLTAIIVLAFAAVSAYIAFIKKQTTKRSK